MFVESLTPLIGLPFSWAAAGRVVDPAVAGQMGALLEGCAPFEPSCRYVGDHFDLNPFSVSIVFASVGQLLPVLRPEPVQDRLNVLYRFFDASRGRTDAFGEVGSFLVGDDWHRRPYRTRQTLHEALDIALAGAAVYKALRVPLPDQPVLNPLDIPAEVKMIASLPLEGVPYHLEMWSGSNESHGGLQFRLVSNRREAVANIGVQIGSDAVSVVQIQGGGKTFGAHRDRLSSVFGPLHPFDWLLRNLAGWARSAGFKRLVGCGYRLNSSLNKHLSAGEMAEARRPHLQKIYDERFLSFGMTAYPELPDIYELPLSAPPNDFPKKGEDFLERLMTIALAENFSGRE